MVITTTTSATMSIEDSIKVDNSSPIYKMIDTDCPINEDRLSLIGKITNSINTTESNSLSIFSDQFEKNSSRYFTEFYPEQINSEKLLYYSKAIENLNIKPLFQVFQHTFRSQAGSGIHNYLTAYGQKKSNISKLDDIRRFKENWNGNNAPPFQAHLIYVVNDLIQNKLPSQPEIFPTANNSIQLEYEKASGAYLEAEVFSEHHINICKEINGIWEEYFIDDVDILAETIEEFIENVE